ncbi:hypothetical protein EZV73_06885 [Acidaminobacter sp. JC074]|uniref:DUF6572 domain-containing protein n=1 Tax=Acidaminobacter sp. JC074 TaxID=2530199 RepID=UPI001F0EB137|nr:DUF6572 domain-containing protein [Acidaminobacter sp. JC074]MCH4887289.1 hypothetical protein [Acidaminobacter sp. JC074]
MVTHNIDLVGYNRETDTVHLIIMDEQNWDNAGKHIDELQEKILGYIAFVENGAYDHKYPEMYNKEIIIEVVFEYDPTKEGQAFLSQIDQVLKDTGYQIKFRNYTSL